jgi:formylglycine-generating enzyme required for sulfatase activity
VGSSPSGASWIGSEDLSGNVYEWTNSLFAPYPYTIDDGREEPGRADNPRVIRGGAWSYSAELARAAARGFRQPTTETPDIGFRCARDA